MRCPLLSESSAELLLAYCARKLDPETVRVLERHMEQCPDCQVFSQQQRAVWEALDAWEALPVSPDFDERLYQRIEASARRGRGLALLPAWLRAPAPLAVASALLVAVLLLKAPRPAASPEFNQADWVEVEGVEKALEDIEMLRTLNLMARVETPVGQRM